MTPARALAALLGLCWIVACLHATPAWAERSAAPANADPAAVPLGVPPQGKLPDGVRPVHYVVELDVDPAQPRFSGSVHIEVAITEPTRVLWMHGRDLHVSALEVVLPNGDTRAAAWRQLTPDGVAAVTTAEPLPVGRVTLRFTYDAAFDEHLAGVYRVTAGGRPYAFTQFEAIDARRAMPCFDEPRFKTPYALTLRVPAALAAVANSPESAAQALPDGRKEVRFQPTPPLPSYLVAFAVGEFDIVEWQPLVPTALRDRAVPLRGIAVKGQGALLRRALALTEPMVTRLERYFDQPYPFDKLDIVAVPDFAAGAMENAALITYRDSILLLGDDATERQRRRMVVTHAHELAHQWVGDLVTPPWWDDIWLNESFATWMENKIAQDIDPEGHYDRGMLLETHGAMDKDSLGTARRIREPVLGPEEIAIAFDDISYQKGGGVLVMLEGFLGEERMRDGIQRYFRRHAGGTATSDDLIRALAEGNGDAELAQAVSSFLEQPGVPMLDVRANCRGGRAELSVRQGRYEPIGYRARARAGRWNIPFCVRTDGGSQCQMLTQTEQRLPLATCAAWVMPNAGANGYYRFALDDSAFAALLANVDALSDREQLAFADSVAAGFRAGDLDFSAVLALAGKLAASPQHEVALSLFGLWESVHWQWLDPRARERSAARVRAVYGPALARLDARQPDQRLFATRLMRALTQVGRDPALRAQMADGAMRFLAPERAGFDEAALPADYLGLALHIAVAERGADAVDLILRKLPAVTDGYRRELLVGALGAAATPELQARVHALVRAQAGDAAAPTAAAEGGAGAASAPAAAQATEPRLRRNEVDDLLWTVMDDAHANDHWLWLRAEVDVIVRAGSTALPGYAPLLGSSLCDAKSAKQLREAFGTRAKAWEGGERTLAQAEAAVQTCVALRAKQEDSVLEALGDDE